MGTKVMVQWIPVRTAAALLAVSRQRVARLCKFGQLESILIDGTRLVSHQSVMERIRLGETGALGDGKAR
jgi:hypothetical protein